MEEILKQILESIKELQQGQQEMRQGLSKVNNRLDSMEQGQQEMRQGLSKVNNRLDNMEQGQQEMRQGLSKVNNRLDNMEQNQKDLQQQINDLRDSMFIEFEQSHKEMGAMRDMQTEALERWNMSTTIMKRVERLLDERQEEVVAIEGTMIDYGRRITKLEQRAV